MSSKEIIVTFSETNSFPEHFLKSVTNISRTHYLDHKAFKYVALVNTNNVDIGLICLFENDGTLEVRLFQAPYVCRMSILSLIDASIYFLQKFVKPGQTVIFKSVHYAHTFKLQQIIQDIKVEGDDYIVDGDKLLSIDMSSISLKKILLENI